MYRGVLISGAFPWYPCYAKIGSQFGGAEYWARIRLELADRGSRSIRTNFSEFSWDGLGTKTLCDCYLLC